MTVATSNNRAFISYRRATSAFVARAVYQDLSAHGIDVFIDVENINAGDFNRIIAEQISSRPYFLLVLSPGTLERCEENGDWLRREIEYALRAKRVIIPLNTSEFDLEDIDKYLPKPTAAALHRQNMVEITHKYFTYAMQALRERFLLPVEMQNEPNRLIEYKNLQQTATVPLVTHRELEIQHYFERMFELSKRIVQSTARLTMLYRNNQELVSAGDLVVSSDEMSELIATVNSFWADVSVETLDGSKLVRFVHIFDTDFMIYSAHVTDDIKLVMLFNGEAPLRDIRRQAAKLMAAVETVKPTATVG